MQLRKCKKCGAVWNAEGNIKTDICPECQERIHTELECAQYQYRKMQNRIIKSEHRRKNP